MPFQRGIAKRAYCLDHCCPSSDPFAVYHLVIAALSVYAYFAGMVYIRSFIFNSLFYLMTGLVVVLLLPLLLLPSIVVRIVARCWGWMTAKLLLIAGVKHRIHGAMMLDRQVIYAAKHQSAWETIVLVGFLRMPVTVMKRELLFLPLVGLFFYRAGCIAVDRAAGMRALRELRKSAVLHWQRGRSLLIFPQGTRVEPGANHGYEVGVFALYDATGLPVVPVALNSGHVWPRNSWTKKPGIVDVRFLPPIAPGLSRKVFMAELEKRIEAGMAAIDTLHED